MIVKYDKDFGLIENFEHDSTAPIGIGNNLFVNFTNYCDFDYQKIDDEICLGLATTNLEKFPMVNGSIPPKLKEKEIDAEFEKTIMLNYKGDRKALSGLTDQEKRKYLFFRHKSLIPWFFILELKPNKFSSKTKNLHPWSSVIEKFPYTKECIEKLPFSEIGRVVIYGSWPEARVPCHRDTKPTVKFNHHINFNPGGYRPVYIYNSVTDSKVYLPEDYKLYAYNTSDYHGVDALPYFSYTVRVDGIYDKNIQDFIAS